MKLKHLILSAAAAACMLGGTAQASTVDSYTFNGVDAHDFSVGPFVSPTDFELVNGTGNPITATVTLQSATPADPSQTIQYAVYADTDPALTQVTKTGAALASGTLTDLMNNDLAPFFTFIMQASTQYVLELTGSSSTTGVLTHVSTVPLPGAIWLFGSALLGFLGFSNRRKI